MDDANGHRESICLCEEITEKYIFSDRLIYSYTTRLTMRFSLVHLQNPKCAGISFGLVQYPLFKTTVYLTIKILHLLF